MLARKRMSSAGSAGDTQAPASARRTIQKQAAEIASLTRSPDLMFAAMLAEMDSRIDDITARTDRLLAKHG